MLGSFDPPEIRPRRLRWHQAPTPLPAPKMALPGHAESYNPPSEYLFTEALCFTLELAAWVLEVCVLFFWLVCVCVFCHVFFGVLLRFGNTTQWFLIFRVTCIALNLSFFVDYNPFLCGKTTKQEVDLGLKKLQKHVFSVCRGYVESW